MGSEPYFYTPTEVAKMMNKSTSFIYKVLELGQLPAVRLGETEGVKSNGHRRGCQWLIPAKAFHQFRDTGRWDAFPTSRKEVE